MRNFFTRGLYRGYKALRLYVRSLDHGSYEVGSGGYIGRVGASGCFRAWELRLKLKGLGLEVEGYYGALSYIRPV